MKYIHRNEGITLIDLIIAIAILGIIIAGFLPLFTESVVTIFNLGERYQYFNQVESIMEEELSKEYDAITIGISKKNIDDNIEIVVTVIERNNNNSLNIKTSNFSEANIEIPGKEIEVKAIYKSDGKVLTSLTSFLPDPDF